MNAADSITLARSSEAGAIARMSRVLIEHGLGWTWTPERVAASMRNPKTLVAVARVRGRIAGFGVMRYEDDEAHLELFGVARDHQRAGLGRRLLEWLEKPALLAGIATVFLEVRASNRDAQAFYARLGYRKLEYVPRYYQGRESAYRMGRKLGRPRTSPGAPRVPF